MADKVIGKNIMLYNTMYSAKYYFNGNVSSSTIGAVVYKQLGATNHNGAANSITKTGDGLIAGFITDIGVPSASLIKGGTWTLSNYISLTTNITGTPLFYYKIYKYNGTTLTLLATSSNTAITSINNTLYNTTVTFSDTVLTVTDRLVVEVYSANIGTRVISVNTEGTSVSSVITTLPAAVPFACSTSCSFSVNVDQKEVTSQTSAWFREYKNDIATWTVSCEGLVTLDNYGYLYLLNQQKNRETILIKFIIDNGVDGLVIISGNANLTSLTINGPYKDIATYSVSLQGTGVYGLTGTTITPSGTVIIGGNLYSKQYVAAGAETTITFLDMIGKSCMYVSRGGIDVREILTGGTPIDNQVKWNTLTGVLTFGRALETDEFVRALFN